MSRFISTVNGRADQLEAAEYLEAIAAAMPSPGIERALDFVRDTLEVPSLCRGMSPSGSVQQTNYDVALVREGDNHCVVIVGRNKVGELIGCAWSDGEDQSLVDDGYKAAGHEDLPSDHRILNGDMPEVFSALR